MHPPVRADNVDNNIDTAERNRIVPTTRTCSRTERMNEQTNGRLDAVCCVCLPPPLIFHRSLFREIFPLALLLSACFSHTQHTTEWVEDGVCCYRAGRSLGTFRKRNVLHLLWLLLRRVSSYFQVDYRTALWYFYKYEHAAHTRINSYTGPTHTTLLATWRAVSHFLVYAFLLIQSYCATALFDVQVKASQSRWINHNV